MAIGIATRGGRIQVQIPKNSVVPAEGPWQRFYISDTNFLSEISFALYEGDEDILTKCYEVGKFQIKIPNGENRAIVIYAKVKVDREKNITIIAQESENVPEEESQSKSLDIKSSQRIYTCEEITALKIQNQELFK